MGCALTLIITASVHRQPHCGPGSVQLFAPSPYKPSAVDLPPSLLWHSFLSVAFMPQLPYPDRRRARRCVPVGAPILHLRNPGIVIRGALPFLIVTQNERF